MVRLASYAMPWWPCRDQGHSHVDGHRQAVLNGFRIQLVVDPSFVGSSILLFRISCPHDKRLACIAETHKRFTIVYNSRLCPGQDLLQRKRCRGEELPHTTCHDRHWLIVCVSHGQERCCKRCTRTSTQTNVCYSQKNGSSTRCINYLLGRRL